MSDVRTSADPGPRMNHLPYEEMGRALFEEAGDALFLSDPETDIILDANPVAARLSGFPRSSLVGMSVSDLFHFEEKGGDQRMRRAAGTTGLFHSQEGFLLRTSKDDVRVPVSLTITRLHVKPKTLALFTARDVREQRDAHARLKKMEGDLRRVINSVPDCLWSAQIDSAGKWTFRFFSPVVKKITGHSPDHFLGGIGRWREIVHPEDQARWKEGLVGMRPGQSRETEYRVVRPDGTVRWVRDSVQISRSDEERGFRLDGVLTDITERKQTEDQLRANETEFLVAGQIQQKLFPSSAPRVPGFDIAGSSFPALAAGGDYFDFLPMGEESLGIVIGDVSGHGFGPALLMAATRAYLRVLVQTHRDVGEILTLANRVLAEDTEAGRFITLLFVRLDHKARSLVYSSAGHPTGYVLDASGKEKSLLESAEVPLGVIDAATYVTSSSVALDPGDVVVLLTDGVLEAGASPEDTSLSTRALDIVRANRDRTAAEIVAALCQSARDVTSSGPQQDDITAVVIKVLD